MNKPGFIYDSLDARVITNVSIYIIMNSVKKKKKKNRRFHDIDTFYEVHIISTPHLHECRYRYHSYVDAKCT